MDDFIGISFGLLDDFNDTFTLKDVNSEQTIIIVTPTFKLYKVSYIPFKYKNYTIIAKL